MLPELPAQRRDFNVHLVQFELHALIDRFIPGTAGGDGARIAAAADFSIP